QINFTQETLGLRRAGFSPALSLLMPTESFLIAPTVLTVPLHSYRMLAYHQVLLLNPKLRYVVLAPLYCRRWAVSLSTTELSPRSLTPGYTFNGIRSLIGFGNLVRPLAHSVLYHRDDSSEARPKAIS